jgi:hypothetical protein
MVKPERHVIEQRGGGRRQPHPRPTFSMFCRRFRNAEFPAREICREKIPAKKNFNRRTRMKSGDFQLTREDAGN